MVVLLSTISLSLSNIAKLLDKAPFEGQGYYLIRPMAVLEPVPMTTALALPAVTTVPCT